MEPSHTLDRSLGRKDFSSVATAALSEEGSTARRGSSVENNFDRCVRRQTIKSAAIGHDKTLFLNRLQIFIDKGGELYCSAI